MLWKFLTLRRSVPFSQTRLAEFLRMCVQISFLRDRRERIRGNEPATERAEADLDLLARCLRYNRLMLFVIVLRLLLDLGAELVGRRRSGLQVYPRCFALADLAATRAGARVMLFRFSHVTP